MKREKRRRGQEFGHLDVNFLEQLSLNNASFTILLTSGKQLRDGAQHFFPTLHSVSKSHLSSALLQVPVMRPAPRTSLPASPRKAPAQ